MNLRHSLPVWIYLFVPHMIFLFPPLIRHEFWFHEDIEFYFYGLRSKLFSFAAEGTPLGWNDAVAGGLPLLADGQLAAFYPLNFWFYLLPTPTALVLYVLCHFAVGSFLCFRFLRSNGFAPAPSTFGVLVFLWSGFFWAHLHHLTFIAAGIWLPAMLLGVTKIISAGPLAFRGWIELATYSALTLLAGGSPQIAYYSFCTVASFALFEIVRSESSIKSRVTAFVRLATGVTVGIGISAIQLVPFFLATLERFQDPLPALEWTHSFAMAPLSLARLIVPNMFGNDFYAWNGKGYVGPTAYWENWCYVGILTLPLVFASFRRRGRLAYFSALFVISFLGCFGVLGGVHVILVNALPLYSSFRAPSRLFFLTSFAAAVLSAASLNVLECAFSKRTDPANADSDVTLARLPVVARYCLVLGLELWTIIGLSLFMREEQLHEVAWVGWILGLFHLGAAYGYLQRALRTLKHQEHRLPGWLPVALLSFDLLMILGTYNHTVPATEATQIPAVVQWIRNQGGHERVLSDRSAPSYLLNAGTEFGYQNVRGYNPLNSERWVRFLEAADGSGRREGGISALVTHPTAPMHALLAGKWHVTSDQRLAPRFQLRFRDETRNLNIYEDLDALPRAWVGGTVLPATDADDVLLKARAFAQKRPMPVVLEASYVAGLAPDPTAAASAQLKWVKDAAGEIQLELLTSGPVIVVLADGFASGWTASLDGDEVPILPAFYALRSVYVSAEGRHTITFAYSTPGLKAGAGISGASLLLLAMVGARNRYWREIPSPAEG